MPYKNIERRKEYIKEWKKQHRADVLRRRRELYLASHPPKERVSDSHKKALKSKHDKTYRIIHADSVQLQKQQYYRENKQQINAKYLKELHENINKRIAHNMRGRLRMALKKEFKSGSAVNDLGCSIDYFKVYIANKFETGMSWENYGAIWHLDHIKPLCRYNLINRDELLTALHYTNYQPLFVKDNLSKNKYDNFSRESKI